MIDNCAAFGSKYQPSNPDLLIGAMTNQWKSATDANTTFGNALMNAKTPIANRKTLFAPLDKLVTKSLNYFESTKANKQLKSNAKTIADKIRGAAKVNKVDNPKDVSVSQQSYVQKQTAFAQLVALYASDATYAPNETELKVSDLQGLSGKMKDLNDNIGNILAPVKNAQISRDDLLYKDEAGIVDVSKSVKDYVKGVFGASAAETKLIAKLKFTKPKKK